MPNAIELHSVKEFKSALDSCKEVVGAVRFGCSEHLYVLCKKDVRADIAGWKSTDTPEHHEMATGTFGTYDGHTLYLG